MTPWGRKIDLGEIPLSPGDIPFFVTLSSHVVRQGSGRSREVGVGAYKLFTHVACTRDPWLRIQGMNGAKKVKVGISQLSWKIATFTSFAPFMPVTRSQGSRVQATCVNYSYAPTPTSPDRPGPVPDH
jgi:hypothetical protein